MIRLLCKLICLLFWIVFVIAGALILIFLEGLIKLLGFLLLFIGVILMLSSADYIFSKIF